MVIAVVEHQSTSLSSRPRASKSSSTTPDVSYSGYQSAGLNSAGPAFSNNLSSLPSGGVPKHQNAYRSTGPNERYASRKIDDNSSMASTRLQTAPNVNLSNPPAFSVDHNNYSPQHAEAYRSVGLSEIAPQSVARQGPGLPIRPGVPTPSFTANGSNPLGGPRMAAPPQALQSGDSYKRPKELLPPKAARKTGRFDFASAVPPLSRAFISKTIPPERHTSFTSATADPASHASHSAASPPITEKYTSVSAAPPATPAPALNIQKDTSSATTGSDFTNPDELGTIKIVAFHVNKKGAVPFGRNASTTAQIGTAAMEAAKDKSGGLAVR